MYRHVTTKMENIIGNVIFVSDIIVVPYCHKENILDDQMILTTFQFSTVNILTHAYRYTYYRYYTYHNIVKMFMQGVPQLWHTEEKYYKNCRQKFY